MLTNLFNKLFVLIFVFGSLSISAEQVLVTGGAGFIGSHVVVELLEDNHNVILVDRILRHGTADIPSRIREIAGEKGINLFVANVDLLNAKDVDSLFQHKNIDAVIHLAGLKSVSESVKNPLLYYTNNIISTLNLLNSMEKHGVRKLVFSSSATVYGNPPTSEPIRENFPLNAVNPYGQTKLIIEKLLMDLVNADKIKNLSNVDEKPWRIVSLRYFNPIGAHDSGKIGDFQDPPNNVMPYIFEVLMGKRSAFTIFGCNYPTPDKTAVRDYVHVVDLAAGHEAALQFLNGDEGRGFAAFNLGTGRGISVMQLALAIQSAINNKFKDKGLQFSFSCADARPGDVPTSFTDPSLAKEKLRWQASYNLDRMIEDSINWALKNPEWFTSVH